ncbi:Fc receptor-like protein 5 isoform X2 [Siphateles boraxobius]|uniref:Fc receptor-like protein 5 isoform X2 n=1 Tax=Siphateles boraxobius TaxID=180520 RepID=UPI00406488C1
METFKKILLTVAVCVQVTSPESTGDPPIQIPKPNISQNPTHKVLYSTETVTLHCKVPQGASELQYDWYKDFTKLKTDHQSSIDVTDGGIYECMAKNGYSESEKSDNYTVTLQEPPQPKLSIHSQWKTFYPNEKVTLKCSIDGDSNEWTYEWFRNGEQLSDNKDISFTGNTLSISSAKASHSGQYTCRGKHLTRTPVTTRQAEALQLHIHDNTPKPDIRKDQWFKPFYTGEKIQLGCNMPGDGWTYNWYNGEKQTEPRITDLTFTINSASLSDTGVYHCTAKRGDFSVDSETLQVRVQDLPLAQVQSDWTEAFPDEKVSLQCVIPETQNWNYLWFKGSEQIVSSDETSIKDNSLTLSVKSSHAGEYTCQAELKDRTVKTAKSKMYSLTVHGSKPTVVFKQDPSYQEIYTGEQVKLTCSIKQKTSKWEYKWQKDSVQVNNHTYTILNPTLDHNGKYTCTISRREMTFANSTKLNIREPPQPKLSILSQWKTFYPNEKVTLKCSIDGDSNEWTYEWFRNGDQLSDNKDISFTGNTLSISSAKASHSGQYTCRGKHLTRTPVTTRQAEALQLHIHDNTPKPDIRKDQWFKPFYTGEKIQLGCNMSGDGWTYNWYNGKKQTEPRITDLTFTINSASLSDTGVYHCTAKRGDFSVDSETLQVHVQDLPLAQVQSDWTEAFPDEKVSLQCVIPETQNWNYLWFKGSEQIVSSDETSIKDNSLTLSVKSSHAGEYTCQAELKDRTVKTAKSKIYSLTVHGSKPTVVFKQDPSYQEIYTGEQVKLTCSIKQKTSKWEYKWQKDSVQVNNHTYTILNPTLDHNGKYTCTISRREMTFANSTKLNIREPPQPKLSILSQWKTFYPNEKVTLKCSIDGDSNEWTYEWFRNGDQLSGNKDISFTGNTLSISSAKASHSGQYTCRGKHLTRTPVTTRQAEALQLHIHDNTPKPDIRKDQWFDFFYTEEKVQIGCNMSGDGWKYGWYKGSNLLISNPNHTINSASLSDTGVYHCTAKRGDFSVNSESLQVQVEARPPAFLNLETELSDIMSGNILTLRCNVSDGRQWSYAWFENEQKLNGSSDMFKVTATEETIKSEFKCKGIRTERPLYSALSDGFTANNIILKRKILLAISGCVICCIVFMIIGCLVLRITRKPEKKETAPEDLFFSMADSKNQTASPLEKYMDNSPIEMEECEEKEELLTDRVSDDHLDGEIKDEVTPAAEANGLTSFKGL